MFAAFCLTATLWCVPNDISEDLMMSVAMAMALNCHEGPAKLIVCDSLLSGRGDGVARSWGDSFTTPKASNHTRPLFGRAQY